MIETILFYSLGTVLLGSGLVVITRTNPLASAIAMVVAFGALAGVYGLLSAGLLAVLQVLVYAGGIMVLMVFVIMLLDLRAKDLESMKGRWVTALLCLLGCLGVACAPFWMGALSNLPSGRPTLKEGFGGLASLGEAIFASHLFPFEMLSMLLLAAVVGALVLSKKKL
jgi:NADH-quinone oxidoreductase subunit J